MATLIELARRALCSSSSVAAAGVFVFTLRVQADEDVHVDRRTRVRCDAFYQSSRSLSQPESRDLRTDGRSDLRRGASSFTGNAYFARTKRAHELHSTYKVDWETVLGEGAYGRVYPGKHRDTGEKVRHQLSAGKISYHFGFSDAPCCYRLHSKRYLDGTPTHHPFDLKLMLY